MIDGGDAIEILKAGSGPAQFTVSQANLSSLVSVIGSAGTDTLHRTVLEFSQAAVATARAGDDRLSSLLATSRTTVLVLAVVALIAAGLIGWFYVVRNLAFRLGHLAGVMRQIADGRLDSEIPLRGHDEITDMGRALVVFRDTARRVEEQNRQAQAEGQAGWHDAQPDQARQAHGPVQVAQHRGQQSHRQQRQHGQRPARHQGQQAGAGQL